MSLPTAVRNPDGPCPVASGIYPQPHVFDDLQHDSDGKVQYDGDGKVQFQPHMVRYAGVEIQVCKHCGGSKT